MKIKAIALAALVALIAGCKAPKPTGALPPPAGDLSYLLSIDPAAVTPAALLTKVEDAQRRVGAHNIVMGIYWQAIYSEGNGAFPDSYGLGGDSLLFTGKYLAACAYRYGVTKDTADLRLTLDALRGIYILTHCSGTPGSLMRCAFPTRRSEMWGYPASWEGRAARGFVYDSPTNVDDPFNLGRKLPQMTFYTRVTRDQITGLVYGLSVFWNTVVVDTDVDPADRPKIARARIIIAQIVEDVYRFLRASNFKIVDHTGRNDTSSNSVGRDLLRLSLLSLYRQTVQLSGDPNRAARIQGKYEGLLNVLKTVGFFPSDPFNAASSATQYYAWNLRFTRASALWMNVDAGDKSLISDYIYDWMFKFVKGHKNAWFSFIYAATMDMKDLIIIEDAVLNLKSWALRPTKGWPSPLAEGWGRGYEPPNALERVTGNGDSKALWPHLRKPTMYWTWQKDPWDAGVTYPLPYFEGGGLDLVLPYWMARYHGLIQ